jgi:dihydrofolate reductase
MRKLSAFNFMTLNGFYKGPGEDISWHKQQITAEENEFAKTGAQSGSILLLGRVTYEMMVSYWPTPLALEQNPGVAKGMNSSEKIVFSRTLQNVTWNNTTLIKDDLVTAVKKLKQQEGAPLTILGSGSIVTQLAAHGLIDEYQFMVDPVALGSGTPVFNGLQQELHLQLTNSRTFKSGIVLLNYRPAK